MPAVNNKQQNTLELAEHACAGLLCKEIMNTPTKGEMTAIFVLGLILGAIMHMVLYTHCHQFGLDSLKDRSLIEHNSKTGELEWAE